MCRNRVRRILKDVLLMVITLASAALFFWGCSPCERLSRRCPPVEYVRDSIVVYDTFVRETTITDTLLYVKLIKETERVSVQITDTARAETAYAEAEAYVMYDNIRLLLTNKDSAEVLVQRIKTLERQIHEERQKTDKTVVKTEYRTRGIVKVGAWIGLAAVIFAVLYLTVIILKRK